MPAWRKPPGSAVQATRGRRRGRCIGLAAIAPQPNGRRAAPAHRRSPAWLHAVVRDRVAQVGSADLPAIRRRPGGVALGASSAWSSRDVIAWDVSVRWDRRVCLAAVARA
jgi:hypothetical protein